MLWLPRNQCKKEAGESWASSWLLRAGLGHGELINWVHAEHLAGQYGSTGNRAPLFKNGLKQKLKDNFISLKKERRKERVEKRRREGFGKRRREGRRIDLGAILLF